MSDEKKEPWLNYLALTTILLAVFATFAQFKGGGYSTRSIMNQSLASDKWAQYQSKSIKGYMYGMSRDRLRLDLKLQGPAAGPAFQDEIRKLAADHEAKVAKYEEDQKRISAEATAFEAARDDSQSHGRQFGLAVIYLQIGIVLSSIAALLKKKPLWIGGLALGAVGVVHFTNGFLFFFH